MKRENKLVFKKKNESKRQKYYIKKLPMCTPRKLLNYILIIEVKFLQY